MQYLSYVECSVQAMNLFFSMVMAGNPLSCELFFFPALQNVLLDLNVQIHGDTIITRSIGETKLLNVRTMRGFVGITLHADDQTAWV